MRTIRSLLKASTILLAVAMLALPSPASANRPFAIRPGIRPGAVARTSSSLSRKGAQSAINAFAAAGGTKVQAIHEEALDQAGALHQQKVKRMAIGVAVATAFLAGPFGLPIIALASKVAFKANGRLRDAQRVANRHMLMKAAEVGHKASEAQLHGWTAAQAVATPEAVATE